jgi:hypothetical protein
MAHLIAGRLLKLLTCLFMMEPVTVQFIAQGDNGKLELRVFIMDRRQNLLDMFLMADLCPFQFIP